MAFPLKKKRLAWVDCETTGLDPAKHEVIEIGIVRSDGVTLSRKVLPKHIETADPEALKINGYSGYDWDRTAKTAEVVAEEVKTILRDCLIVTQNAKFDYGFVEALFREAGVDSKGVWTAASCA